MMETLAPAVPAHEPAPAPVQPWAAPPRAQVAAAPDTQPDAILTFYEELAEEYEEQFPDWAAESLRQGEILDGLIRERLPEGARRVLDCACGIGTQAIGLSRAGYRVHCTDLSPSSIEKARAFAAALDVPLTFVVAAFSELPRKVEETFDVVCACDNALPHLLKDEEMLEALRGMRSRVRPGGLLVLSIRDYDRAVQTGSEGTVPRMYETEQGARVLFQIWQWMTPRVYRLQHFMLRREGNEWRVNQYTVVYRALQRAELTRLLEQAGLTEVRWHMPEQTGYHQPVVTAISR